MKCKVGGANHGTVKENRFNYVHIPANDLK